MSRLPIVSLIAAAFLSLLGCASQRVEPSDSIIREIRSGDYGMTLDETSFAKIKGAVTNEILNQIRLSMVDPRSTYMAEIQIKDFKRCVLRDGGATRVAKTDSSKGYCVAYSYNSKNRMGGYGGAVPTVALVRIERDGKLNIFVPTRSYRAREDDNYPYTINTDVYVLSYLK